MAARKRTEVPLPKRRGEVALAAGAATAGGGGRGCSSASHGLDDRRVSSLLTDVFASAKLTIGALAAFEEAEEHPVLSDDHKEHLRLCVRLISTATEESTSDDCGEGAWAKLVADNKGESESPVVWFYAAGYYMRRGALDLALGLYKRASLGLHDGEMLARCDLALASLDGAAKAAKWKRSRPAPPVVEAKTTPKAECVACMTHFPVIVLDPCKHLSLCETCWQTMKPPGSSAVVKCPVCRTVVTSSSKVFVS